MHAVALCELSGSAQAEAEPIAAIVGVVPYHARVWLAGTLPRVVLQTADHGAALDALRRLRARGHGALLCDLADVVSGTSMVRVHRFAFDDAALWANDGVGDFFPWEDIAAIVVVARRIDVVRTTREIDVRAQVPGRPAPRVATHERRHEHINEHVAYLFPRARPAQPWLMHEQDAQYLALGPRMRLTRYENFRETIALLRERAPGAIYDERYAGQPLAAAQLVEVRGHESAVPELADTSTDLLVHVLAEWLLRGRGGPYRDGAR